MSEREGFWWVRCELQQGGLGSWEVGRVDRFGHLYTCGDSGGFNMEVEWGPYLGKEPPDLRRLRGHNTLAALVQAGCRDGGLVGHLFRDVIAPTVAAEADRLLQVLESDGQG